VLLPFLFLLFAAIPAAVVAYGIDPFWAQYPHGIALILFARRFQGPLIAFTLIFCIALIGFVIAGKRRAWWLVGLAPILTLLGHRFVWNPQIAFLVNARPNFVAADQASFMSAGDWVVGLVDGPDAIAFPYASLYSRPLVVRSNQPQPMMLMWSPFANCAAAERVDRSIRAEELEIVSMPANTLLVFNSRVGQFINGITGKTMTGQTPAGFVAEIPTIKATWDRWLASHPSTLVLAPPQPGDAPHHAVLPYYPMPKIPGDISPETRIALIRGPSPAAVLDADLTAGVTNFSNPLVVLVRDPATGSLAAFDRHVDQDLVPAFATRQFKKFPQAMMIDSDSGSVWTPGARAIFGPLNGKKLATVEIEDGLYYGVTRFWYRDLPIIHPLPPPVIHEAAAVRSARRRHPN
jgi:hypothetical protein